MVHPKTSLHAKMPALSRKGKKIAGTKRKTTDAQRTAGAGTDAVTEGNGAGLRMTWGRETGPLAGLPPTVNLWGKVWLVRRMEIRRNAAVIRDGLKGGREVLGVLAEQWRSTVCLYWNWFMEYSLSYDQASRQLDIPGLFKTSWYSVLCIAGCRFDSCYTHPEESR